MDLYPRLVFFAYALFGVYVTHVLVAPILAFRCEVVYEAAFPTLSHETTKAKFKC